MDLLRTMKANREASGITAQMKSMSIGGLPSPQKMSLKAEIIEKKPKHKKVKEYFEQIVQRACDENSESESE